MFVVIDCGDVQNLEVAREDPLLQSELGREICNTAIFDTYEEAEEFAESYFSEYEIVELTSF